MNRLAPLLLSFLLLLAPAGADPQTRFDEGNQAMEAGRYSEALEAYREVLKVEPGANVLWNAGLAAYLMGDGAEAVRHWSRLKDAEPEEWSVRAKLVQAYQLQGDATAVEEERQALLRLWSTRPDLFKDQSSFCRDQFRVGKRRVMAYEHFELVPPRGRKYTFFVLKPDSEEVDYRISLGSYDATNDMTHEMQADLPREVRVYHLDGYYNQDRKHATFDLYRGEPDYGQLKTVVEAIVEGRRQPVSSSEKKDEDDGAEVELKM